MFLFYFISIFFFSYQSEHDTGCVHVHTHEDKCTHNFSCMHKLIYDIYDLYATEQNPQEWGLMELYADLHNWYKSAVVCRKQKGSWCL